MNPTELPSIESTPMNQAAAPSHSLAHLPVALFSTVMGIAGLALAWQKAARLLGWPAAVGQGLVWVADVLPAVPPPALPVWAAPRPPDWHPLRDRLAASSRATARAPGLGDVAGRGDVSPWCMMASSGWGLCWGRWAGRSAFFCGAGLHRCRWRASWIRTARSWAAAKDFTGPGSRLSMPNLRFDRLFWPVDGRGAAPPRRPMHHWQALASGRCESVLQNSTSSSSISSGSSFAATTHSPISGMAMMVWQ